MRNRGYAITTTVATCVVLFALFALRFVGFFSHQALAVVLVLGLFWAVVSRSWLAWKGHLNTRLLLELRDREGRLRFFHALGRASFWVLTGATCLWVFPRSQDLESIIVGLGGVALLRVVASFLPPRQTNSGPALVMLMAALLMAFDFGRALVGGPAAALQIAPPFEGEWLVVQGGPSPLQNHHLTAYNQRFAVDIVRLENGYIFGEGDGNASVYSWEQWLSSPADGKVVVARDEIDDAEGPNSVRENRDAAGNELVIQLESGYFIEFAHLRRGTLQVKTGDQVRKGDPLAQVGNSGNTTLPHLHLQVQTHPDTWDPDNRSVPFAFDSGGRALVRNDRVGSAVR